jgi:putative endonuclease
MPVKRKDTGIIGEKLAQSFLKKRGYRILETNYRCRRGEIDIIACQGDCLVFVEVRTKSDLRFGLPEESLTAAKMIHLEQASLHYQQQHNKLSGPWRIDVVAIELDASNQVKRIELIENALEG